LSKLANFVQFIERNDFWAAQVVQINVTGGSGNGVSPDKWKEPQVELIPRAGDHVILLGELDGTESERLANLRTFYERAMWQEGWDTYHHINIRYANQIVCTK
jgi:cell division protein FtsQ